jgi:P27 family predicted phage terminase small subunit
MGRPQKSEEWHRLAGTRAKPNQRNEHDRETDAPTIERGKPKMPKDLTESEQLCWKQTCKILKSRGCLSKGDSESLELYSRAKARYLSVQKELGTAYVISEERFSKSGDPYTVQVKNPLLAVLEQCERALQTMARSLCLTVADRQKIKRVKNAPSQEKYIPKEGTYGALLPHLFNERGKLKGTAC